MEKINIIKRYSKSITNFQFSNYFIKETTGKAIGFMLFNYLLFVLVIALVITINVRPEILKFEDETLQVIDAIPDFTIESGVFSTSELGRFGIYDIQEMKLIVDLDEKNSDAYYGEQYSNYILIRENAMYANSSELINFSLINQSIQKNDLKDWPKVVNTYITIALIVIAFLGILAVFVVSLLSWGVIIIVNGFVKKEVSSGDCYKIAIYSMLLPGILLLISWSFNIVIPYASFIYIFLVGFYGFQYLKSYTNTAIDLNSIYE